MTDEPKFDNWKDAWEWHAQEAARTYEQFSEEELLELIQKGRYDAYYSIWDAVPKKCTLPKAAPVLISVLRREAGEPVMLVRYHCAGALFKMLGYPSEPLPELRTRAQWDHQGEEARQKAINELEQVVKEKISGGT